MGENPAQLVVLVKLLVRVLVVNGATSRAELKAALKDTAGLSGDELEEINAFLAGLPETPFSVL